MAQDLPPKATGRRPRKKLHIVQLIPNFMTIGALCAGLTAVRFAIGALAEKRIRHGRRT
jgi:hypothetical protein